MKSDFNIYKIRMLYKNPKNVLTGHTNRIRSVAFSPDGQILASGGEDNTVKIWDTKSGECLHTLNEHKSRVICVHFSSDGKTLYTASIDSEMRFWQLDRNGSDVRIQHIKTLNFCTFWQRIVSFSPDGQTFVTDDENLNIKLWSLKTTEPIKTLEGHNRRIMSVVFTSDNKTLVSGGFDETIKIWDINKKECKAIYIPRPYEKMNITHIKGLTEAQKATLKTLGAIEHIRD